MIGEGRYVPPEARDIKQFKPEELTTEDDFTEFWLAFRRNNPFVLQTPERERRTAAMQAKAELRNMQEQNKPTHIFGVKDNGQLIAAGKIEIRTKDDEKHGYLSMLTVDENYRGKGLAKQLTDVRMEIARDEGCTHIDTDVFTENPIALVTKLNDGYTLADLEFYGDDKKAGRFVLSKKIDGKPEYDKREGPLGGLQELELSDLSAIKNLLEQGWVGIDAKNLGDSKDKDPKQWKLIMEQTTK
ncbi:MAG: GNAT family N-acetyltransferase [Patescibacteria group bacterium]